MHIVLVDSGKTQVNIMTKMVQALGYDDLRTFVDGAEAWKYIRGPEAVDLLITGLEVAGMSGLELAWHVRTNEKTALSYILVVTSSDDEKRFIEALDCGADDYLHKPLNAAVLWARLRAANRVLRMQNDLYRLANRDPLTGLFNRRAFGVAANLAIEAAEENATPLALLLMDVDHFKSINDTHGHDVGDQALMLFASTASRALPANAVLGRVGGEEFAVLLPEADMHRGAGIAEDVRARVAATSLSLGHDALGFTISIGLTALRWGDSLSDLMKRADQGLYAAKKGGRNRAVTMPA
ncbi:MAG: diguanylate cyclase [Pseudomonadota bacterium]